MTTVCPVAPAHRDRLAAVRHVDDTARVQTVTSTSAPELAAVLAALDHTIGMPIALNTSFNGAGEPIIGNGIDAVGFLLSHPIDALVVGDLVITRNAA
ncbi:MAG: hypothetical protein E6J90_12755 [Deltaproteobacteria bacterium]|nr:MAG: hypothetical protein E6J90_12755 [Deltaproteobacteria bacterium]